jgi:hypothetical protein
MFMWSSGALRPRWWAEIVLVVALYFGYDATRDLRHSGVATADDHGWLLLHAEQAVHLDPEHALNQVLWHLPVLAVLAAYFYATLHFLVTPAVLAWMYRSRPEHYRSARSVLLLATAFALAGFWLFPTAPPRMLAGSGIHDSVADVHQWGWWSGASVAPRGLAGLGNDFAAMPSLHVAWALWAGLLIHRHARSRVARGAGLAYPVLTALVVMSTGNHYLFDVLAGAAVMTLSAAVVRLAASQVLHVTAHVRHFEGIAA